jgi:hypothetical protein
MFYDATPISQLHNIPVPQYTIHNTTNKGARSRKQILEY